MTLPEQPSASVVDPTLIGNPLVGERDAELAARFEPERLQNLCEDYLRNGTDQDLFQLANGRQFVVAAIPAESPYADIATSVETIKFAKIFKRSLTDVYNEYEKTNPNSTLLTLIHIGEDGPEPAGALRVIEPSKEGEENAQKSIVDLVADVDTEENPWIDEIKSLYFAEGEAYDPDVAWARLCEAKGIAIDPAESHDIATIAVHDKFAANGALDGPSLYLYHSCLRYALANGIKNLVSIQDIRPLQILQNFGNPFDTFKGLTGRPYGGPFDTIPAYCVLETGMANIRSNDAFTGQVFIDGFSLKEQVVLLEETDPEKYSNEAVELPTV